MSDRVKPPPFPTVTIRTPDGDVTVPCEPVGEHIAIIAGFGMTDTFEGKLFGSFDVVLRKTGAAIGDGGCIACARRLAHLVVELPGVDWSADQAEIEQQIGLLPAEQRQELAAGADLSWGCDTEWCDGVGPGVVTIPVPR